MRFTTGVIRVVTSIFVEDVRLVHRDTFWVKLILNQVTILIAEKWIVTTAENPLHLSTDIGDVIRLVNTMFVMIVLAVSD